MNPFTLPHVVNGDPQVNGFVDQYELPTRKFVHQTRTVQVLIANLDIKVVDHAPPVRLRPLRPEADFKFVVEAAFQQGIDQR